MLNISHIGYERISCKKENTCREKQKKVNIVHAMNKIIRLLESIYSLFLRDDKLLMDHV